jgi:ribokinase
VPKQRPIAVVGSINTDLVSITKKIPAIGETVLGTDFQIHPGGKGANQAVAIARLGYPVRLIGRLGSDSFAAQLRSHLDNSGVNTEGVRISEGSSGVAVILVSAEGENCIVVTPGANSQVTPQDLDSNIAIIREAGLVLAQLELPIETIEYLARLCEKENVPLMLDPAPATDLPATLFERVEWFTPNQSEAAFFLERTDSMGHAENPAEIAERFLRAGVRGVVLKMGVEGVYLAACGGIAESVSAFPVTAIDTTAAGDAFNGGFAAGLMLGKTPLESARFGCAVAAISVTRPGAQPSMPSMAEVEDLLRSAFIKAN